MVRSFPSFAVCDDFMRVPPAPSTARTDGMSWGPSRIREVGILFLSLDLFNRLKRLHLLSVATQEFLFYYQRDPAQERLPSGGG
jgi:hypothetical protein